MKTWHILFVFATWVACGDNKAPDVVDAKMADAGKSQIERGRYIMNNLGVCTFCHTPLNPDGSRDLTRLFAGVDCLVDIDFIPNNNFGCISSRNLTNDPTGLMFASDAQIKYAFQNGYRTDGKPLAPLMPYWLFHNMADADADAIIAYLRTVPGVNHVVTPNEPPWSFYNDGLAPPAPFLDPAKIPMPMSSYPNQEAAMRGRYLSTMVGLCVDCHTPTPDPMSLDIDQTKFFIGGRTFPRDALGLPATGYPMFINTRNLTSDTATGLGSYTLDDIKNAVAKGKDPMGNAVCAGTHGSVISPYAALDPGDLDDIADYIKSLAPVVNDTSPNCAGPPVP